MNRRFTLFFSCGLLLFVPGVAVAQQIQTLLVRVGVGLSDDFGGNILEQSTGLTHPATIDSLFGYLGLQYTYRGKGTGLFISADYAETTLDLDAVFGTPAQDAGRPTELLHLDVGFDRYFPTASETFQPYVGAGLGVTFVDIEALGSTDAFTVFLDGGFEQRITRRFGVGLGTRIRWLTNVRIETLQDKPVLFEVFFSTLFTLRR